MRAFVFTLLLLWLPAAALAKSQAELRVVGDAFEVGVPVSVELVARETLDLESAGGDALKAERGARQVLRGRFGKQAFELGSLDYSWQLVGEESLSIRRLGTGGDAMLEATRRFQIASYEAGDRSLPAVAFNGEVTPLALSFTGALGADEDQARPLVSFQPVPDEVRADSTRQLWWVGSGIVLLVLGGLLLVLKRRRSSRGGLEPGLTAQAALEAMAGRVSAGAGDPMAWQAEHFELTRLVRACLDGEQAPRTGTTDSEWLAESAARLGPELTEELEGWLRGCAAVKYGGQVSTAWGLGERLTQAAAMVATAQGGER